MTAAPSCAQHPQGGVPIERQSSMATLVIGEPAKQAGLDRAAPATLRDGGVVAGAEVVLTHRALPSATALGATSPSSGPDRTPDT